MKRWRITPTEQAISSGLAGLVVAGVGTPDLAGHCLTALSQLLPAALCTVYTVGNSGRIETVSAASTYGNTAERTAARYVERRFDRRDPHMTWLAARKLPTRPQLWLGHHRAEDILDAEYRAVCYDDVGIRERASLLLLLPSGQRAALSLYRSHTQAAFSDSDFAVLQAHAPFLAEAITAHSRSAGTRRAGRESPFASRLLRLSLREREVIGQLMAGRTAKEAARALGVELTTLRTHQYRAFRRLEIRTLKELLLARA